MGEYQAAFDALTNAPVLVVVVALAVIVVLRIPAVNRRLARLLDPLVRWWTRGTLIDQVIEREQERLYRRTQDVDIMEAYLDYVARALVEVRAIAAEHSLVLPPMKTFRQYKTDWIAQNPEYRNEFGSLRGNGTQQ